VADAEKPVAQIDPENRYSDWLVERVVDFLQTRNPAIFPFTAAFDEQREKAFIRDLREGLGNVNDSGSARKSSATGFVATDRDLRRVIEEWAAAGGGWPDGSNPEEAVTGLGSSTDADSSSGDPARVRSQPRRVVLSPLVRNRG
jgi:hypothetical protein